MYICVCKAVTERQIREAIGEGARSLKDLRRKLGITEECGQCAATAQDYLKSVSAASLSQNES